MGDGIHGALPLRGRARTASLSVVPRSVKRARPGGTRGWPRGPPSASVVPAATSVSRRSRRRSTSISKSPARRPTRRASSGVIAPAEVLEGVRRRVPGREDGRPEPLEVAVRVAGDRPDVVGRDHAAPAVVEPAQDEDDAEVRQLVVGQADRRPAEGVEDLVERVGVDRRGQAVADRGGPDRDPGGGAPRVGGQCGRTARGRAGRSSSGRIGSLPGAAGRRDARPAELRRLRQPVERLVLAGQLDDPARRRQEVEQRRRAASSCRRAAPRPRRRSGRAPRRAARASRRARHRACRPISSTIERGSGGTGRNAQRPCAGEVSATAETPDRCLGGSDGQRTDRLGSVGRRLRSPVGDG